MKEVKTLPVFDTDYFTALLGIIDEAVIATDENFIIRYWNRRAEHIFGYMPNEALGKDSSSILNFVSGKSSSDEAKETIIKKGRWRGELCCKTKAGNTIVLDTSVIAVKNKTGDVKGYVCWHKDITEYDKTKESLATFLSMLSSMDDNFFVVDNHLDIVFIDEKINRKLDKIFCKSLSLGDNIQEALKPSLKEQFSNSIKEALIGNSNNYEINVDEPERSTWLQMNFFPVKDASGHITHACTMIREITAQKEIERVNELFYKSRKIFEVFMENSPILAWINDKNGVIRYLNPAYLNNYHLSKDKIGKKLSEVFAEEIALNLRENDLYVIKNNSPLQTIEKSFTPDGKEHIYRVVKFPIINDDEMFVAGWAIDITEEVQLRQTLASSLEKLQDSEKELKRSLEKEHHLNDMKSRFVSMASHEFRTPLSTILSSTYLLEKYSTTEQHKNRQLHINEIKDSIHHLNSMLEDFLSLGKLEEGKIFANFNSINVVDLITNIIEEFEPFKKEGQQIIFSHKGETEVISDQNFIKNIAVNLLSNAIKFSEINKSIQITSAIKNDNLKLTVKDSGIGISEEDQQHLFQSFFRGKNAQNIEGTGLGLHIVKRYVDLLNGAITIKSELGKGTLFEISIPFSKG